ncbi:MAG: SHOCT domain-containing protein [Chloroflexi bacterium]|nr:SHOCT domain-containing protein [Chloroflexota bacterium]
MRGDLQKAYDDAKKAGRLNPMIGKGMYDFAETQLSDGEEVLYLGAPNVGILSTGEALKVNALDIKNKTAGVLLITSKRLLHCSKILFSTKVEQITLENINNMESKGGLLFSALRVQSVTNVMEIDIPSKELNTVSRIISEAIERAKAPRTQDNQPQSAIDAIKKLGELRDQGILTETEFTKKKEELLSRI